jgi:hypothetical protein
VTGFAAAALRSARESAIRACAPRPRTMGTCNAHDHPSGSPLTVRRRSTTKPARFGAHGPVALARSPNRFDSAFAAERFTPSKKSPDCSSSVRTTRQRGTSRTGGELHQTPSRRVRSSCLWRLQRKGRSS